MWRKNWNLLAEFLGFSAYFDERMPNNKRCRIFRRNTVLYCLSNQGLAFLYIESGFCFIVRWAWVLLFIHRLTSLGITLLYMFAYADHIHCLFILISCVFTCVYCINPLLVLFFMIYWNGGAFESMASHGINHLMQCPKVLLHHFKVQY